MAPTRPGRDRRDRAARGAGPGSGPVGPGSAAEEPSDAGWRGDEPEGAHVVELDPGTATSLLRDGQLEVFGRLMASSNNAMLGTVSRPGEVGEPALVAPCVYKPIRGERPLWDFPDGTLAGREVAAYRLSEATGWTIVPPTVLRDGPFGQGMVQLWLQPDESIDRVALVVEGDARLRPIALFDAVANNADRKVGHLLPMADGHVFGVDHGICFHAEPKLRTVLWRWRGEHLTAEELAVLRRLRAELDGPLGTALGGLLDGDEVRAVGQRIHRLVMDGCFPHPDPDRPAIPWPPY